MQYEVSCKSVSVFHQENGTSFNPLVISFQSSDSTEVVYFIAVQTWRITYQILVIPRWNVWRNSKKIVGCQISELCYKFCSCRKKWKNYLVHKIHVTCNDTCNLIQVTVILDTCNVSHKIHKKCAEWSAALEKPT